MMLRHFQKKETENNSFSTGKKLTAPFCFLLFLVLEVAVSSPRHRPRFSTSTRRRPSGVTGCQIPLPTLWFLSWEPPVFWLLELLVPVWSTTLMFRSTLTGVEISSVTGAGKIRKDNFVVRTNENRTFILKWISVKLDCTLRLANADGTLLSCPSFFVRKQGLHEKLSNVRC